MSGGVLGTLDRTLPAALPQARRAPAAARRWGWQLLAGLAVFAAAELTAGISVYPLAGLIGEGEPGTPVTWNSHPVSFLLAASLSALAAVTGYWVLMRCIRGTTVTELAGPRKLHEFLVGMGLGALLMSVVVAVLAAVGCYRVTAVGWDAGILIGASSGLAAGFAEEILFRGVLLRLAEQWLGTGWALALTAVLFGIAHITNPEASEFGAVAIMLEAGVLLGACYLVTRRLWLAFGTHVAWNFFQGGIFGSDVSGNGMGRGLFEARFSGPELLTGGEMGIEGSLVAVVLCTAAGIAMLLVARRRGLLLPRRNGRVPAQ
ncbi:CPBP family intramembrane glutamic endopeptidase [Actinomyces qiguomingii]|uniref:CPBP family intramembrane glutamic endopeptidase n=1 Tax=Actinomyces qiguomingii TaxID=2057800 RepID=UPI000CA0034C|nr:CPBP family intramembrane glutamic endopeptidase [Actinomyces qiguomingii]